MINQIEGIPILSMVLAVDHIPQSDFRTVSEINIKSKNFSCISIYIRINVRIMI